MGLRPIDTVEISQLTTVVATNRSMQLLASNSIRVGAMVYNDSNKGLYLKLGAGATSSDYSVKIAAGGYYEIPFGYTGTISGTWEADMTGQARITELT